MASCSGVSFIAIGWSSWVAKMKNVILSKIWKLCWY